MEQSKGEYLEATLAQMCVCKAPVGLKAERLGSGVGVMLWDTYTGIGGLVEIMQPQSKGTESVREVGMYADTGIAELIRRMELLGAKRKHMLAKIAGGAALNEFAHISDMGQIGLQNVEAVRRTLEAYDIFISGEDVGMEESRTIYFQPADGKCTVSVPGMQLREI